MMYRRKTKLSRACPVASLCVALGERREEVKKRFDGFLNFKYAQKGQVKVLGSGGNGTVYKVTHNRGGYKVVTALKLSKKETGDNLLYESIGGTVMINHLLKRYLLFLETFGTMEITDESLYQRLVSENASIPTTSELRVGLKPVDTLAPEVTEKSCAFPTKRMLMIEYIDNPVSFRQFLDENAHTVYGAAVDIPQILFQVYSVLVDLVPYFSHLDLHSSNLMLYQLPRPDQYVKLIYVLPGGLEIPIYTRVIAKLIDYGRAFTSTKALTKEEQKSVPRDLTDSLKFLRARLCKQRSCNTTKATDDDENVCGRERGYHWLNSDVKNPPFITSFRSNISHDLRLITSVAKVSDAFPAAPSIINSFKDILRATYFEEKYGTRERTSWRSRLPPLPGVPPPNKDNIVNIPQLLDALVDNVINTPDFAAMNRTLNGQLVATIRIFCDGSKRSMEYLPT